MCEYSRISRRPLFLLVVTTHLAVLFSCSLTALADGHTDETTKDALRTRETADDRVRANPTPTPTPNPNPWNAGWGSKPQTGPVPALPEGHAYAGHGDPDTRPYDIWSDNCHTAANAFVLTGDQSRRGILACKGTPQTSQAYHTANWEVRSDGKTCVLNWGDQCCWNATANPPSLNTHAGEYCARWACKGQFVPGQVQFMPAGHLVEVPGPAACARIVSGGSPNLEHIGWNFQGAGQYDRCVGCCNDRANYWSGEENGWDLRENFFQQCRELCNGVFNNGIPIPHEHDSPAVREGRICSASAKVEWTRRHPPSPLHGIFAGLGKQLQSLAPGPQDKQTTDELQRKVRRLMEEFVIVVGQHRRVEPACQHTSDPRCRSCASCCQTSAGNHYPSGNQASCNAVCNAEFSE